MFMDIVKILIFLKLIYRVNAIPIKIPGRFFMEYEKLILKFICNYKGPEITTKI